MVCAECMKMCCLGGKNSVVKGLICVFISLSERLQVAFSKGIKIAKLADVACEHSRK